MEQFLMKVRCRFGLLLGVAALVATFVFAGCGGYDSAKRNTTRDEAIVVNGVTFDMVFVGGGTFTMGCVVGRDDWGGKCHKSETPSHQVVISDFSIGKYPVTQAQWRAVTGGNPSHFTGDDLRPVEWVSWDDVLQFILALNALTGREFRLPTEAEWEFAARGGVHSKGFKYSGGNKLGRVGWFYDNSGNKPLDGTDWDFGPLEANNNRTHRVGSKRSNELGIFDMSGNVFEWVNDFWGKYSEGLKTNPAGPARGSDRVFRGGSWNYAARDCQVSTRFVIIPDFRNNNLGFRLALSSSP
jgi:formylglycine-generating enzyme required for sulfatase activity